MNKKFVVLIAILLAIVLSLTLMQSCNKQSTEEAPESAVEAKETPAAAVTEVPAKEEAVKPEETDKKEETETPEENKAEEKAEVTSVPVPDKIEVSSVKTNEDGSVEMSFDNTDSTAVMGVVPGNGPNDIEEEFVPAAPQQPAPTPVPTQAPNDEPLTIPLTDITFEIYNSLSAAQQQSVIDQFGSSSDFMIWYNYIKAEYEAANPSIEIGADGIIDLSQVGNGN